MLVKSSSITLRHSISGRRGAPDDLVGVHIRWGDKWVEAGLRPIGHYVDAVRTLASRHNLSTVSIFVTTEDRAALDAFRTAARASHPSWTVFADDAGNIVCGVPDPCLTHFGPRCDKVPTCKHGTPSVGADGDGTCAGDCNPNWVGPNCDDCDATHAAFGARGKRC